MKHRHLSGEVGDLITRATIRAMVVILVLLPGLTIAQDSAMPEKDTRPVKNTFESIWLMNHQTVMVPVKKTLELDFQHRFGTWENGYDDLYGLFASSNIRLGVDYVPAERLLIGLGFTKENLVWDLFGKYAILRQGRSGGSPVSISYYLNTALDTRQRETDGRSELTDWLSFYNQIMVARKFSDDISLQVSGNLSWFNYKDPVLDVEGNVLGRDDNAQFSFSALGRFKLSNTIGLTVEFDQPITTQPFADPEPNLGVGLEFVTSSHAFQLFISNFNKLVPQYDHSFNANQFGENQILIGFNVTRLWNF